MQKVIKTIVILLSILLIIYFIKIKITHFMYTSPYFNIREINIAGVKYISREKVLILSHIKEGDNIFKIDIVESARKIKSHPLVRDARIIRRLPDAIDIEVEERKQVAYIMLGKKYGLDEEGVVLPLLKEKSPLPVVTGLAFLKAEVGERLDIPGVKAALNVLESIKDTKLDEYIKIEEINVVKPANVVLYTADRTEIRLGNFPIHKQFESLKLVLVDLIGKGTTAEYIDLRFGEKIAIKERKKL